jgi:hypothetical protein
MSTIESESQGPTTGDVDREPEIRTEAGMVDDSLGDLYPETADEVAAPVPEVPAPVTVVAPDVASVVASWRDLQGRFVDDPAAVTREAAELVQGAIRDLSREIDGIDISTEDLRTAFRRFRDLHRDLVSWTASV